MNAPYQAIATQDGWVNLGAANQANWERMLAVIDARHLNDDARFSSNPVRMQNRLELVAELEVYFRQRKTDEWVGLLNEAGIPAGPILDILQMHQDPQAIAREMIVDVDHPRAGQVKTLGSPVKFHGTPGSIRRAAPLLGEHSREVLAEAGFTRHDIDRLIANKVLQSS